MLHISLCDAVGNSFIWIIRSWQEVGTPLAQCRFLNNEHLCFRFLHLVWTRNEKQLHSRKRQKEKSQKKTQFKHTQQSEAGMWEKHMKKKSPSKWKSGAIFACLFVEIYEACSSIQWNVRPLLSHFLFVDIKGNAIRVLMLKSLANDSSFYTTYFHGAGVFLMDRSGECSSRIGFSQSLLETHMGNHWFKSEARLINACMVL